MAVPATSVLSAIFSEAATPVTAAPDPAPSQNTMSVENASGFAVGEILRLKKVSPTGFNTEYVFVNSSSRNDPSSDTDFSGNLFVTRSFGNGISGVSSSV